MTLLLNQLTIKKVIKSHHTTLHGLHLKVKDALKFR